MSTPEPYTIRAGHWLRTFGVLTAIGTAVGMILLGNSFRFAQEGIPLLTAMGGVGFLSALLYWIVGTNLLTYRWRAGGRTLAILTMFSFPVGTLLGGVVFYFIRKGADESPAQEFVATSDVRKAPSL